MKRRHSIIIYNIPPRSVVDMSVDTMKRLVRIEKYRGRQGMRQAISPHGPAAQALGPDFIQLSGEDMTALA